VGEAQKYLFVTVANQSPMLEDGDTSTQNGIERRSS